MKKIIFTFLSLIILCIFSFNAVALSVEELTPPKDFLVYSEDPKAVAKALKTDQETLVSQIVEQKILFLAVNKNNSKQIKLTEAQTDFSLAVGELSYLLNGSIEALLPDITGLESIKGEIIVKENQKYVKTSVKPQNGDYVLTQYFTVTDKKIQTLSFYTNEGENTDYIEKTFEAHADSKTYMLLIVCICGTVIFGGISITLLITLIKDLIRSKKNLPE